MQKKYIVSFIQIGFFILFLNTMFLYGQANQETSQENKYKIGILNGSFIPEAREKQDKLLLQGDAFMGKYFKLIQFYELPTDEDRSSWQEAGLILTDYLPGNLYFAVIDSTFDLGIIQQNVRALLEVDDRFKKDGALYTYNFAQNNIESSNELEFTVSYYAPLKMEDVIADLQFIGIEVTERRLESFQLDLKFKVEKLNQVVALPYVQFIEFKQQAPVLEGWEWLHGSDRANTINVSDYYGATYNGDGITIAIAESGNIGDSIDYKGRLNNTTTTDISGHKQGVCFRATNAGNSDPTSRMGAWGSSILNNNSDVTSTLYNTNKLRFTNHSYGWSVSGGYNSNARSHDLAIASYPKHMVLFSSGNEGSSAGYAPYNYSGWANITGAPKMSKNNFAIGVVDDNGTLASYSSRGPAYDGRIIPQIVTASAGGTSYAVPKATGYMAILAQTYKAKNGNVEADSNLLGAVLMNTADDLGNPGPDFRTGYGRVNMRRAYNVINSNQLITNTISNGQQKVHSITIPPNTKKVKVMLLWPDRAASVNANPAIVNNLNLLAIAPNLSTYNPWVLDSSTGVNNLNNNATRQVDNINTFEQVTVDNPEQGSWTFQVSGANVPFGPQKYFIVYEFLMDEVSMTYPLKGEKLISGTTYPLYWDSYGASGSFTISYQLDGGSWTTIATNLSSNLRKYNWTAPTVTGIKNIKFRIQRGSLISESDYNTVGKVPQNLSISQSCNDAVKLTWSAVIGATSYNVYRLGAKYMELVTNNITFYGTSAILRGQNSNSDEYYAVSAVTSGKEGQRTNAIKRAMASVVTNPLPTTVSIATSNNVTSVCVGSPISFTATPTNGGTTPIYQWKRNGINVGTNASTYTYVPTNGDVITCVLNSSEVCATDSPKVSNAINVVVNTTAMPTASAQTLCSGAKVSNLLATGTGIQWYNVATGGTPLSSATLLATGTYYATQTLNGCESARKSVNVTINTTAMPTASAQTLCSGAKVSNLLATGTGIKWYDVATGGTPLSSTIVLATGTYYATQTLNGCESARKSVSVTINTTAMPTASAQTFCPDATVLNLVATGTGIKWYDVATGGTPLSSATLLATGTYYATQTLNGCESARKSVSIEVTDTASAVPDVSILPTITSQCSATVSTIPTATDACSGVISATTTSPLIYSTLGTHTILWQYDDGHGNITTQNQMVEVVDAAPAVPDVSILPTITSQCSATVSTIPTATDACSGVISATTTSPLEYSTLGTYTILWQYDDGHGNITTQNQTVEVVDNVVPICNSKDIVVYLNDNGTVTIQPSEVNDNSFDNCSIAQMTVTPNTFNENNLGINAVVLNVIDSNGNISSCNSNVLVEQSLKNNNTELNSFLVYPNPFEGAIFIEGINSSAFNISLFDIGGREIYHSKIENKGTVLRIDEFNNLASGLYLLRINENEKSSTIRLIKK